MAFNTVPVNGWPQIKKLEELDAIAQQIADMPTFTSSDRAFLADLPAYPETDGTKVLTATTSSGETSLSYEEIPNELPADPETDGVKVLTATTTSGETVKSWEDPATGGINYSTEEQDTGLKWIDGKTIYQKTFGASGGSYTSPISIAHGISNIDTIVSKSGSLYYGSTYHAISIDHAESGNSVAHSIINADNIVLNYGSDYSGVNAISKYDVTICYTKATT